MSTPVDITLTWEFPEHAEEMGRHLIAELRDLNARIQTLSGQRHRCLKMLDEISVSFDIAGRSS